MCTVEQSAKKKKKSATKQGDFKNTDSLLETVLSIFLGENAESTNVYLPSYNSHSQFNSRQAHLN